MQSYDWTTTVSGAVEQLAADIGLKNYQEYTLFEARKVRDGFAVYPGCGTAKDNLQLAVCSSHIRLLCND